MAAAREAIAAELGPLDGRPALDVLVGIGGAITNLAGVELGLERYEPGRVGAWSSSREVDRQIELYRARDAEERRAIRGLQPKRAEVILAGACIVRTVLAKLGRDSLTVSDQGLRHGVLLERFSASRVTCRPRSARVTSTPTSRQPWCPLSNRDGLTATRAASDRPPVERDRHAHGLAAS